MDSDGFVGELVPLWIEAGINCCEPVEVAAGNDLPALRRHYAAKAAAMAAALTAALPAGRAEWQEPDGGFFFWLRLAGRDSGELFKRAVAEKVAFLPGNAFYPDPDEQVGEVYGGADRARLCFTFADPAQTVEGCRRLARAL